jgi:competence protein ComEA
MKIWWIVALGVIFGLLSAGVILLASQPPRGNPISLLPPPTPIPIQVHVSGEVSSPGVYALPPGSRLEQAIQAAGGFTTVADPSGLNLAAILEDGLRIQVPAQTPTAVPAPAAVANPKNPENQAQPATLPEASLSQLININTATQAELETLSGIGPVTAQKIIAFREANGPFTSIEEIQKVSGIGPATFEKIKDFITVDQ